MAFESNAQSQTQNRFPNNGGNTGQNDSWKADAFLNIMIPTDGGKERKLGAISLKLSKNFDRAVIERLQSGGEEALKALSEVMVISFNMAEGEEGHKPAF